MILYHHFVVFRKLKRNSRGEQTKDCQCSQCFIQINDMRSVTSNGDRLSFFNYHGNFSTNNDEPGAYNRLLWPA